MKKAFVDLAAGWYIALESKALGKKPKAIKVFGQPLVVWRDKNGHTVIMKRYCSHMGASLALGQVVNGYLQCPFHHWSYDRSGQCVHIPDIENIPPTACQTTYVSAERYGYIWVWYGCKSPLFSLPEFSAAESERHNYMPSSRFSMDIKIKVRRLLENSYDYSHFVPVHGLRNIKEPSKYILLNDQHLEQQNELLIAKEAYFGASIETQFKGEIGGIIGALITALGLKVEQTTLVVNSWSSGNVTTIFFQGKEKLKILIANTPVDESNTTVYILTTVRKSGKFWLDILHHVIFSLQTKVSGREDALIWNTMNSEVGGAYVKHDHLILKFREFYQRWVDKVQVIDIS